jgi:hypothetical protein
MPVVEIASRIINTHRGLGRDKLKTVEPWVVKYNQLFDPKF